MLEKSDLEPVFQSWYDHKMDPGDDEHLRVHHATIDNVKIALEQALGYQLSRSDVRHALRERFGVWMKEHKLPPLPKNS